jgi:hypothetical protein|tara:strand:+ start:813 stop:929 length:117 start_codon:yes stop_codon:yes gene_type:complete
MPKITIVDCSTGEEIVREMNAEELATYEKVITVEAAPE